MRKIILIIIDGLGDGPIPELGNKTPLEAARKPNLNFLAENGSCGLVLPFKFSGQKTPESDTSHLALFGYDPEKYYMGRGVYEAAGVGIKMKRGDIAFRGNFGNVNDDLEITDRRAGRIEKTQPLVDSLNGIIIKGVKFILKKSYGHRAVLILRSEKEKLSSRISDGDPHETNAKAEEIIPMDDSSEAEFTAEVLNDFLSKAHKILDSEPLNIKRQKAGLPPGNYLLIRGAGEFKGTADFGKKYGMKAGFIAGGALYKGIGMILGMREIPVKGATGFANTDLKGKISAAKRALKKFDFVFLHIKAADSLAEDGNFRGKKEFIERIDENIKPLIGLKDTLIIVTGDHSTCSEMKKHCSEPVPILIFGAVKAAAGEFSEKACAEGGLGRIEQVDLMSKILKADRGEEKAL